MKEYTILLSLKLIDIGFIHLPVLQHTITLQRTMTSVLAEFVINFCEYYVAPILLVKTGVKAATTLISLF